MPIVQTDVDRLSFQSDNVNNDSQSIDLTLLHELHGFGFESRIEHNAQWHSKAMLVLQKIVVCVFETCV